MARAKNFLRGLGSGYLLLLGNTVWTLLSLPFALHFLGEGEYTVWLLVSQVASYLAMIDLGTSGSGIRLLVDHKDAPDKGDYGSLIQSMCFTQLIQAGLILALGLGATSLLPRVMDNLPPALVGDFQMLWIWQVIFLSMNFALRIGNQILNAHQRIDISNCIQVGAFVLNLALLLGCLQAGLRLYSFVIAQGVSSLLMLLTLLAACVWLKLLPPRDAWGSVSRGHLKRLIGFGSEFFLIILGTTLISGSQIILLTRFLKPEVALEAALVWGVMTKPFTLCLQIVWKIVGAATPAFSEMFVRGEMDRLWKRYRSVLELSVLLSGYLGLLIGFGNNAFIEVWTRKPFHWAPINNWLLAVWLLLLAETCCHTSLILYLKRVQALKIVYLIEGAAFVLFSSVIIPRFGITGMLLCSIGCTLSLTWSYGTYRLSELVEKPPRTVAVEWLLPLARFLAIMLPIGIVLGYFTRESSWLRLAGCVAPLAILGPPIALRYCVPCDLLAEFILRLPRWSRRLAGMLVGNPR
ncbi:MAG TPA: hypothetical protein VK846_01175 [Candidatus Limnocylindria bacterium]|nr:hypothetical protein [Candidatus Limnocylindria bacterium]